MELDQVAHTESQHWRGKGKRIINPSLSYTVRQNSLWNTRQMLTVYARVTWQGFMVNPASLRMDADVHPLRTGHSVKFFNHKDLLYCSLWLIEKMLNICVWISNQIHKSLTPTWPQKYTKLSQQHTFRQLYRYPLRKGNRSRNAQDVINLRAWVI